MAKVIHTIKGLRYWYEHTRINGRCICKYLGPVDGYKQRTSSPRLSDATKVYTSGGQPIYASQKDLDNEVHNAYSRGFGIKRLQEEIFAPIDLHPSRREVENYLKNDLDVVLRTRSNAVPQTLPDTAADLEQAKIDFALNKIACDSKDVRIAEMRQTSFDDANEILRLKEKLIGFRDMGRAPTDAEIEELIG
jgi:hypothetical protein